MYLLNKVYRGFYLYSFSYLCFGISSGSPKEFEKRKLEKSKESSRRKRKSNHVKMFVYFSKSKKILKKR